jgi:hypothetical protein
MGQRARVVERRIERLLGMTTSGDDEHECTGPRFDDSDANAFRRDIFNELGTFNIELAIGAIS